MIVSIAVVVTEPVTAEVPELSSPPALLRPTMPKIIGKSTTVVDHEGLTIDELAGNVATSNDRISIAHVKVCLLYTSDAADE